MTFLKEAFFDIGEGFFDGLTWMVEHWKLTGLLLVAVVVVTEIPK